MTFLRLCAIAVFGYGCAKGGAATDDQTVDASTSSPKDAHVSPTVDAPMSTPVDAHVTPPADASIMIDAALPPDAASTDGDLCSANAQCTDSGECCLSIGGIGFCSPGILIGSTCLPN
jgi:hypothetical protein